MADLTTEYLYQREVDRVLAALMPQNQLIVRVMLQTGMRLSDALRMPSEGLVGSGWYTEGKIVRGTTAHAWISRQAN